MRGPPGKCLGAITFVLYTIDLKSTCACDSFLYPDAAAVITSHKDKAVEKITVWCVCNNLTLHLRVNFIWLSC